MKTENPSSCITVNSKMCVRVLAIALQLSVDPRTVYKVSINPIIQSKTSLISHAHPHNT
jgi:hypothetical protein